MCYLTVPKTASYLTQSGIAPVASMGSTPSSLAYDLFFCLKEQLHISESCIYKSIVLFYFTVYLFIFFYFLILISTLDYDQTKQGEERYDKCALGFFPASRFSMGHTDSTAVGSNQYHRDPPWEWWEALHLHIVTMLPPQMSLFGED